VFDPAGPVLGVDPGLSRCGYGAVVRERGRLRAVAAGVLRTDPADPLPDRLAALERDLADLVSQLRPSALAVERVLFQVNVRTAISVGQASGLALAVAARASVPVVQYSPNEVKLAVTGDGGAGKPAVQAMVARLLRLAQAPQPPDAADALALACCHCWRDRLVTATATATGSATGSAGAGPVPDGGAERSRLAARIEAALDRERTERAGARPPRATATQEVAR
jgi:crossover junction endodeoxyribonuclease RuvC